jgi:hypothetical protein
VDQCLERATELRAGPTREPVAQASRRNLGSELSASPMSVRYWGALDRLQAVAEVLSTGWCPACRQGQQTPPGSHTRNRKRGHLRLRTHARPGYRAKGEGARVRGSGLRLGQGKAARSRLDAYRRKHRLSRVALRVQHVGEEFNLQAAASSGRRQSAQPPSDVTANTEPLSKGNDTWPSARERIEPCSSDSASTRAVDRRPDTHRSCVP